MRKVSKHLDYEPVIFKAYDIDNKAIYHTNVMMWIGTTVAAICADAISDPMSRDQVTKELRSTGREVLYLSHEEMQGFAGNCLELRTRYEELVLAISHTAVNSLRASNLAALQRHLRFLEADVETIETIGGGGIRCMIAGVHFEQKNY